MRQGTRRRRLAMAATLGVALTLGGTPGLAHAEKSVRWQMQSAYAAALPSLGAPAAWLPERIARISNAALRLEPYDPGELVPTFEIMEAVSDGRIAAGYTWIGYDQDSLPATFLFSQGLFTMKPWEYIAWHYHGDGHELLQATYTSAGYNIHAELCAISGPETAGWYRQPITSLEDYDGLKIRFAGLGGEVLKRLGAAVTVLPPDEIFEALETGAIDAAEFSIPAVDEVIGFQRIVDYNLYPGWQATFSAFHLLVNGDAWAALTEGQRSVVRTACMASVTHTLAASEAKNPAQVAALREQGVELDQIPRSVLDRLKHISREVFAEQAEQDAMFKQVWDSQRAFMENYDEWEQRAYLPPQL